MNRLDEKSTTIIKPLLNPKTILVANPEKQQSEFRTILPYYNKQLIHDIKTEENISQGNIDEINQIKVNEDTKDLTLLSPRYDQKDYNLCWAFSLGRVFFRYIYKAIQLGLCHSNINLGKNFLKKNNFSDFANNLDDIKLFINLFTDKELEYLFSGSSTDYKKIFQKKLVVQSGGIDINLNAPPTFIRQTLILNFIIVLLVGLRCNFNTNPNKYNVSINRDRPIILFLDFINDYIEITDDIYLFFNLFGYSHILVDYILNFLYNLNLKNSDTLKRFNYEYIDNVDNIDNNLIKSIFKRARKQGLYIYISLTTTREDVLPYIYNRGLHAMYAIPTEEGIILKNSWGNNETDIFVEYDDLRKNYKDIILFSPYFNYNNPTMKTIRIPRFQQKKRISLRNPNFEIIKPSELKEKLKANRRTSLTSIRSLNLTKKNKKSRNTF